MISWDDITTEADLEAALGSIRALGMAFQKSPDGGQVQIVAVPVLGPDGEVWAALAVHPPAILKVAAREASDALAAVPSPA